MERATKEEEEEEEGLLRFFLGHSAGQRAGGAASSYLLGIGGEKSNCFRPARCLVVWEGVGISLSIE